MNNGRVNVLLASLCILLIACVAFSGTAASGDYLIGLGSHDITGPAADVNLMGYANPSQNAAGIHFRLRARTFIIASPDDSNLRFAFVNLDACMASDIVTQKVVESLKERYGELYSERNVAISGIHTHSGPGGYLQYVLYIVTSLGFVKESFKPLVDGIVLSIIEAHENIRPGSVYVNVGELLNANINRSPSAYLNNPQEERARYLYDTDKDMTLLKFVDDEWGAYGAFSWYATHGTSMSRTNRLISGDNKGAAARLMEDLFNVDYRLQGNESLQDAIKSDSRNLMQTTKHFAQYLDDANISSFMPRMRATLSDSIRRPFVAAFCQSNVGDTSPNVLGAFCSDTGLPCDFEHSTCNGKSQLCIGHGPAFPDEFASTKIIGQRQFEKAAALFGSATKKLAGKIDYRHTYVDFSKVTVNLSSTSSEGRKGNIFKTCPAAVGFSFAAGTTDGPGAFNFVQGDDEGNPFWKFVGSLLKPPSQEQIECQQPKPILIDTGDIKTPYHWAPDILPLQILQLGNFIVLCVPSEFTTMAGRRLRESVKATLIAKNADQFNEDTAIVIAGLTNSYSQYVATYEEYQVQRYEGASTLYGPHTLSAYIQEFTKLAIALAEGTVVDPGPSPPDLLDKQIELLPGVVLDAIPPGSHFGNVIDDVPAEGTFNKGDIITARFQSACPRNDLFTERTYTLVEKLTADQKWIPAYDDDDLSLRFLWSRPSTFSPFSVATVRWEIPDSAVPGTYRLRHFGAAKTNPFSNKLQYFTGTSGTFLVS
ncbi:hypothetical protein KP509_21G019100 [Ceratopteris richardii]|uniref:Neutral ceramidase n=1 Tax=Ceratopteris richardii TaxID=49495 RepID=A0A8T2S848_CERRI|nr:hypothetical protein KP509_21G019100 [Ceratopteris richardii]